MKLLLSLLMLNIVCLAIAVLLFVLFNRFNAGLTRRNRGMWNALADQLGLEVKSHSCIKGIFCGHRVSIQRSWSEVSKNAVTVRTKLDISLPKDFRVRSAMRLHKGERTGELAFDQRFIVEVGEAQHFELLSRQVREAFLGFEQSVELASELMMDRRTHVSFLVSRFDEGWRLDVSLLKATVEAQAKIAAAFKRAEHIQAG